MNKFGKLLLLVGKIYISAIKNGVFLLKGKKNCLKCYYCSTALLLLFSLVLLLLKTEEILKFNFRLTELASVKMALFFIYSSSRFFYLNVLGIV